MRYLGRTRRRDDGQKLRGHAEVIFPNFDPAWVGTSTNCNRLGQATCQPERRPIPTILRNSAAFSGMTDSAIVETTGDLLQRWFCFNSRNVTGRRNGLIRHQINASNRLLSPSHRVSSARGLFAMPKTALSSPAVIKEHSHPLDMRRRLLRGHNYALRSNCPLSATNRTRIIREVLVSRAQKFFIASTLTRFRQLSIFVEDQHDGALAFYHVRRVGGCGKSTQVQMLATHLRYWEFLFLLPVNQAELRWRIDP